MAAPFLDRRDAGRKLGERLSRFAGRPDVVVLALPRGGVPVGREVARRLGAALDVFNVRKLGAPGHDELAMGAIASGGVRVLNPDVLDSMGITEDQVEAVAREEQAELERRERLYRGDRAPLNVRGRVVILVDDGLATGATMQAAVAALRAREPSRLVVAVPVGSRQACEAIDETADACVCLHTPEPFQAVGLWYRNFRQTTDEEVQMALSESNEPSDLHEYGNASPIEKNVIISHEGHHLEGVLGLPVTIRGVVAFAHGSGSGRHSPRNRQVARALRDRGFATLLLDLLEPSEAENRARVFDIGLLADRLSRAVSWLSLEEATRGHRIGLFGASTGAGAALVAASRHPEVIRAVVSRGGRPDLAGSALRRVSAPTLLIVGGHDEAVIDLNRRALAVLPCVKELAIVPGATHLFSEPGALEEVARLAGDWFMKTLIP